MVELKPRTFEELTGIDFIGEEEARAKGKLVGKLESDRIEGGWIFVDERGKVQIRIPILVEAILNEREIRTVFGNRSEEIYLYEEGIWKKTGKAFVKTEIERKLGEHCSNYYVTEALEKIKRITEIPAEEFEEVPEHLLCFTNGTFDIKEWVFEPGWRPEYHFKRKIPIEYDPIAACPTIEEFFETSLYPDDIPVIEEWFGFCLYRRYFIKKAIILFGPKDTGKSVMLNLLTEFLNEKNTAGLSLQRIGSGDKFGLSSLKEMYANIFDDLTSEDMVAGGFKMATGGAYITAEYKFGDPFKFKTFAKLIFAGNKIPATKDIDVDDMAYYGRWIPIAFDNILEKHEQDPFLINKLTAKDEMSGLLNKALAGLKRLLQNNSFTHYKTPEEIRAVMERHSTPLSAFCQDVLVEEPGNIISKEAMYEIYSIYVKAKKMARLTKEMLGRKLPKTINYIIAKGGKKRVWQNVAITDLHVSADTFDTFKKTLRVEIE